MQPISYFIMRKHESEVLDGVRFVSRLCTEVELCADSVEGHHLGSVMHLGAWR